VPHVGVQGYPRLIFWNLNYFSSCAPCLSEIPTSEVRAPQQHAKRGRSFGCKYAAAQAFPFSRGLRSPLAATAPPARTHSIHLDGHDLVPQPPASVAIYSIGSFGHGFSVYGVRSQGMIQSFSVLLQALFVNNNLFAAFTRLKGTVSLHPSFVILHPFKYNYCSFILRRSRRGDRTSSKLRFLNSYFLLIYTYFCQMVVLLTSARICRIAKSLNNQRIPNIATIYLHTTPIYQLHGGAIDPFHPSHT
jgi:hypothetical protein